MENSFVFRRPSVYPEERPAARAPCPRLPMPRSPLLPALAVALGLGVSAIRANSPLAAADEQVLKSVRMETDNPSLLQFFRQRTLSEDDRRELRRLVAQLDAPTYD